MDKKELIKKLMMERKEGTDQLYVKIPVFMRTRLSDLIDKIDWADISEGCEMGKTGYMQLAQGQYNDVIANMNQYLKIGKTRSTDTDNTLFMMADYNYIVSEYGSDPSKFAKEMAYCIHKENELIEHYKYDPTLWLQSNFENQNPDSLLAMDLTEQDSVEMEQVYQQDPELDELEKMIDEAENYCNIAWRAHGEISQSMDEIYDTFMPLPEELDGNELPSEDMEIYRRSTVSMYTHEHRRNNAVKKLSENKKLLIEKLKDISTAMEKFCYTLENLMMKWKNAEAKKSVGVGPGLPFRELHSHFNSFGRKLQRVLIMFDAGGSLAFIHDDLVPTNVSSMSPMPQLHQKFKEIKRYLFQINLVVEIQPKDLMSIESAGKKEREDSAAAIAAESSKKPKNYRTKKNQNFETSVIILAAECFKNPAIENARIELVSERDLASNSQMTAPERRPKLAFTVKNDIKNAQEICVKFIDVAVTDFSRIEQNTVYKQFFRIQYFIDIVVNDVKYSLKTLSLPFMFHTGSNQILELIGARMWYFANVDDMYCGAFTCPDTLHVDKVLSMLDNRVTYLDKRQRNLMLLEKEFLKKRLPIINGDQVTMQGFIKDKMKKTRNQNELPFSFHTWFHAVLHSIQENLLEPWLDGIIYGFCNEETTEKLLMESEVSHGTFILRPSISNEIKNMSSKEATAALTMDIKLLKEEATDAAKMYEVQSVPIFIKTIRKNSLYGAIYGIVKKDKPIAKFVKTAYELKPVSYLKRYKGKTDRKNQIFEDYKLIVEKMEKISIRKTADGAQTSSSNVGKHDDLGSGPSNRKRRLLSTQTSTSSSTGHGRSTKPVSRSASSEDSRLPTFNDMAISELSQEPQIAETFPLSQRPIPTQGQRSGHQSNSVPETQNPFQRCIPDDSIFSFHGIQVDTSKIVLMTQFDQSIPVKSNDQSHSAIHEMSLNLIKETAINDQCLGSQLMDLHRETFISTGNSMDSVSSHLSPESWPNESSFSNLPTVLEDAFELSFETESRSNINRNSNLGFQQSFGTTTQILSNGFSFPPNRNGLSMNDQNMNPFSSQPTRNQLIDPWGSPNDSGIDGDEIPSPEPVNGNK